MKINICLNCGKQYNVGKNLHGKFCCFKCSVEYRNKKTDEKIENGDIVSQRVMKSYLLRHYHKCMCPTCKWEWNNSDVSMLEIHHIDGDANNTVLSNCILICPNCHSLTDNYKNKGARKSTRLYRKKYY